MCGRSSLTKSEKELEARFKATFYSEDLEKYNPLPNFNVAPTHVMPVLSNRDTHHFSPMRWGLVPFWAKDAKVGYQLINARMESVLEKPAFKFAMEKRRCLVPMDGYYEWKKDGKKRVPYRIVLKDQDLFAVAGLWEKWKAPDGQFLLSFSVITQPPSNSIAHIHDRMPAILQKDQEEAWLDMSILPADALSILCPYEDDFLLAYEVSARVGNVNYNDSSLIEPVQKQDFSTNLFE